MVLYRADLKKVPSSQRILLDISLQITEGLQREHLPQGSFACVVLIHKYLHVLSLLLLFTKAKDLRILCLLSYQLVAQCGLAQPSGGLNRITP